MLKKNVAITISLLFLFSVFSLGCTSTTPISDFSNTSLSNNSITPVKVLECPDGALVTNLSECKKCPLSCDDSNPCTSDLCSLASNFTCTHSFLSDVPCGSDLICSNGFCIEETQSSNLSQSNISALSTSNITFNESQEDNISISLPPAYFANESKALVMFINRIRQNNSPVAGFTLVENSNLNTLAKKCAAILLANNRTDLTPCYNGFGSFRGVLSAVGFEGSSFFFVSKAPLSSSNLSFALYDNLSNEEKNLLTNQSVDHHILPSNENSFTYEPFLYDSIGTAVLCDSEECLQVSIASGNKEISRYNVMPSNKNYGAQTSTNWIVKTILSNGNSASPFKPFELTVTTKQDCQLVAHEKPYVEAYSNYWWTGDYNGNNGYSSLDWTIPRSNHISTKITHPAILYLDCIFGYSGSSNDGSVEVVKKYIVNSSQYSEQQIDDIIAKSLSNAQADIFSGNSATLLDVVNSIRTKEGYPPFNASKELDSLIGVCTKGALTSGDYSFQSCSESAFSKDSGDKYAIDFVLGVKGFSGSSWYFFGNPLMQINSTRYLAEELAADNGRSEGVFGDGSKYLGYFGYNVSCEGGVCLPMYITASNEYLSQFSNVRKDWAYGMLVNSWIPEYQNYHNGIALDYSKFLSNMTFTFNSSVNAKYYVYKAYSNRLVSPVHAEGSKWAPNGGYVLQGSGKTFSGNLSPQYYYFLYLPDDSTNLYDPMKRANFTLVVNYIR